MTSKNRSTRPLAAGDRVQLRKGSQSKGTILRIETYLGMRSSLVRYDLGHARWEINSDLRRTR